MDWTNAWTLTYLIWWVARDPCLGIFIAPISLLTLGILLSSSVEVAKAIAAFGAVPFTLILLLQLVAFL
jgi:choline-glycine betaine transporter